MSSDKDMSEAVVIIQKYIRLSVAQQQYQQLKKMNVKRTGLVKEILATETNYVHRLTILEEVFKKPLEENAISAAPFITKQQIRNIFSDVEVILNLTRVVLQELKERVNNWNIHGQVGDIFVKLVRISLPSVIFPLTRVPIVVLNRSNASLRLGYHRSISLVSVLYQ